MCVAVDIIHLKYFLPFHLVLFFAKNKRGKQAPFQARVEMCRILFKDTPNVIVTEAERICFEKAARGL